MTIKCLPCEKNFLKISIFGRNHTPINVVFLLHFINFQKELKKPNKNTNLQLKNAKLQLKILANENVT